MWWNDDQKMPTQDICHPTLPYCQRPGLVVTTVKSISGFEKMLEWTLKFLKGLQALAVVQQRSKMAPPIGQVLIWSPLLGQRETASNKCGGGDASHKRGKTTKGQIAQCKKWSSCNRTRRKSHCCLCPGVVLQWREREGLRGDTGRTDHPIACHQLQTVLLMWDFILWQGSLCGCRVTQHTLASQV